MGMCDYKKMIEDCIWEYYPHPHEVCGKDLYELGEWIDICKDIAEMNYYKSMTDKNLEIVHAMNEHGDEYNGKRSLDSVMQSLENIVTESIETMMPEEKEKYKMKFQRILDMMSEM